ncbi:MAG: hypothetical protein KDE58_11915 [Caldilineaceae bacterium]|nr:hypothetical protein [Caldilineaceae bacterium]
MVKITLNDHPIELNSIEELGMALDDIDRVWGFELWATVIGGPRLCMLRNCENAWLMYLQNDDLGFTSVGNLAMEGTARFTLSNGQVDEYPLAWCIDVEQCYKAVAYFYVNDGEKPEWIHWQASQHVTDITR